MAVGDTKTIKAKSVVISRKRGKDPEGLWTAFIGLFDENNPHLKGNAPFKVLEYPEVEKIRIRELRNVSYYLQGNDIVINNLKEVVILQQEKHILRLSGTQDLE